MSTRALTSVSPTANPGLARSRHHVRITISTIATSYAVSGYPIYSTQVRRFWGRGWKVHNELNRREVVQDMARNHRGQYMFLKRMAKRKSAYQQDWDGFYRQSHRWRQQRDTRHENEGRESEKQQRNNNNNNINRDRDMDEIVKRIEADPYNFLFGRSNEYLQLPQSWSAFCQSFLYPEAASEQPRNKTSSVEEQPVRKPTSEATQKISFANVDNGDGKIRMDMSTNNNEDLQFDPVSGRMRPREKSTTETTETKSKPSTGTVDLPAKISESSNLSGLSRTVSSLPSHSLQASNDKVLHMSGPTEDISEKKKLEYNPKEVKEEDVDLLRTSDIRASFFSDETKQELVEKKALAREALEQDYASTSSRDLDDTILHDLKLKRSANLMNSAADDETLEQLRSNNISQSDEPEVLSQEDFNRDRQDSWEKSDIDPEHIWLENSVSQSQLDNSRSKLESSLGEILENTRDFINDVRKVTEDILKACEQLETSATSTSDTLRILAYDSTNSQIVWGETTSTMLANERMRHPAEVLLHINNPAKFLPHFAKMKADGYEIVSGGGDIIIFRKIADGKSGNTPVVSAESETVRVDAMSLVNDRESPRSDTTIPEKNDTSVQSPSHLKPSKPRMVHRQETLYTGGPPNWSPYQPSTSTSSSATQEHQQPINEITEDEPKSDKKQSSSSSSRIGKTIRHVFLSGVATAGTFYAIGVVWEYFLTGGSDGLGPEGFTEFEAERRRRE